MTHFQHQSILHDDLPDELLRDQRCSNVAVRTLLRRCRRAQRVPPPHDGPCIAATALLPHVRRHGCRRGPLLRPQPTLARAAGLGGAQMRAAAPLAVSAGVGMSTGLAGGRSLALLQPRPSTVSGRPQARLAAGACSLRSQQHGQQPPARWQQADAPPLAAVDRRAAASGQARLCRRWQQQQLRRQRQAGQARRPQTAVCSVPAVAAGGGEADHHGEAAGERALHPTALTAL